MRTLKKSEMPLAVNLLKLQGYNFNYFDLDEVIFFEYLVIKGKSFKFKEFYHCTETISRETGIKKARLKTIITKFEGIGIIKVTVKGMPKVKYFIVDFVKIAAEIQQIYQLSEIGKLNIENGKLLADFYQLLAESYQQKNNITETLKEELKKNKDSDGGEFLAFKEIFNLKIEELKIKPASRTHDDIRLYNIFTIYGDSVLSFLEMYFEDMPLLGKVSDFLSGTKISPERSKYIDAKVLEDLNDAKRMGEGLISQFNNRRTKASTKSKALSATQLIINSSILSKIQKAIQVVGELSINNAFIAYSDAIINETVVPRKILPYFFTEKEDSFPVIEEYLDYFNVNYAVRG